jgi:hypothetical protein
MSLDDIAVKTRTLIDAQNTVHAADHSANNAADDAADRTGGALAFP